MAITPFVAGWWESTSVIFQDQLPINKNIVRNPLHTILQTGLYARHCIKYCSEQNYFAVPTLMQ